jgi:hypothetical protein
MSASDDKDPEVQYVVECLLRQNKTPDDIARLLMRCAEICEAEGLGAVSERLRAGAGRLIAAQGRRAE